MKKLLLILLCVPFIGFGQTKYVKEYYENGQLSEEGNYKDGELISIKCWDKKGKK